MKSGRVRGMREETRKRGRGRERISLAPRGLTRSRVLARLASMLRSHALRRLGRWRNVPSGEEREEKAVFAGHMSIRVLQNTIFLRKAKKNFQFLPYP